MATFNLENIKIAGISCAVPNQRVETTSFYSKFGQKYVDDFINMAGVKSTYRTPEEQTSSDLCYVATRTLMEKKSISTEEIGACVFISQTPDYRVPATACVLHKRLGLSKNCMVFDVNLGCSGWVYGLNIVGSLFKTSNIEKALLLFGDTPVKHKSPEDKSTMMLFGEAGSATLIVREDGFSVHGELMTDGDGFKAIIIPSGAYRNRNGSHERTLWNVDGIVRSDFDSYMDGTEVFSFTISQVPKLINSFMEARGKTIEDYDALVLHQANLYILKQIARKTKFPMEKVPVSLDRYGNTSGTSIPITLCDAYGTPTSINATSTANLTPPKLESCRGQSAKSSINLLMSGFGIGLSWGVVEATLDRNDILPVIYTDEYYTEGAVSHD